MTTPVADPWLSREFERARELLDRNDTAEALSVLREADRVARAQGFEDVRPTIAALVRQARPQVGDTRARAEPAAGSEPAREARRHPNLRMVGYLWLAVYAGSIPAAFVLLLVAGIPSFAAGLVAGAFAAVAGLLLTFVYFAVALVREPPARHPSWWVVGAIALGGGSAGLVAELAGGGEVGVSVATWALVGVYVAWSFARRGRKPGTDS